MSIAVYNMYVRFLITDDNSSADLLCAPSSVYSYGQKLLGVSRFKMI